MSGSGSLYRWPVHQSAFVVFSAREINDMAVKDFSSLW
jgi:hypothetical protein